VCVFVCMTCVCVCMCDMYIRPTEVIVEATMTHTPYTCIWSLSTIYRSLLTEVTVEATMTHTPHTCIYIHVYMYMHTCIYVLQR